MESVLVVYVFYLSPSFSALNCLATMQANVGPMAAPSSSPSSSSAAPPTNRSMSDGSAYSVDSSSQEEGEISRGGEDQEQAGLELF